MGSKTRLDSAHFNFINKKNYGLTFFKMYTFVFPEAKTQRKAECLFGSEQSP